MKSKAVKFVKISDNNIDVVFETENKERLVVGPDYLNDYNGRPTDALGRYYEYVHTEIKPVKITVHVRGGVAYPPTRLPKHVILKIVDHDHR